MRDTMIVQDRRWRARKAGNAIKEVGLVEFRFQPDLFERGHVSAQAGAISIWIRRLAATNC
jgi:hypothetical protein